MGLCLEHRGGERGNATAKEEAAKPQHPHRHTILSPTLLQDVQAALEAALEGRQISYSNNVQHPGASAKEMQKPKSGEIELAIPIKTAEEFMEQAAANGDEPTIKEDQLPGVKFVDYSNCL